VKYKYILYAFFHKKLKSAALYLFFKLNYKNCIKIEREREREREKKRNKKK